MPHQKERQCSRTHVQTRRRTADRYGTSSSLSAKVVPTRTPKFEVSIGILKASYKKRRCILLTKTNPLRSRHTTAEEKIRKNVRKYKSKTFYSQSSSPLIVKIAQLVSGNIPGTWYEVLLYVLPFVSPTTTTKKQLVLKDKHGD